MNKERGGWKLLAAGLLLSCSINMNAQEDFAVFYSMAHPEWPPLPMNALELPTHYLSNNVYGAAYALEDLKFDYEALSQLAMSAQAESMEEMDSGGGSSALSFGPDDLWIQVVGIDPTHIHLTLHGTEEGKRYQLESKADLGQPGEWKLGEIITGASGANQTDFSAVARIAGPTMFFRAHQADIVVYAYWSSHAIETNSVTQDPGWVGGIFVGGLGLTGNLIVPYRISGSAANGVDYESLAGVVTLTNAGGFATTLIDVQTKPDNLAEFVETVTLTLVHSNAYLIEPQFASATVTISDNFGTNDIFTTVAHVDSPIGIDYHAPSNSLVVAYNFGNNGQPNNFALIDSNGVVKPNWSGVANVPDEVKVATVKATMNGFTNGDMYFGSDTAIGWLSADGTRSNLTWCTLTNSTVTNSLYLRGSLHVDRTGVWSNHLIAVTSSSTPESGNKGVWLIDSNRNPTLITQIFTRHLEGVITLTNDVQKWGPWAGKIITGDEVFLDGNLNLTPLIYSVDTNGVAASYALGIHPEDFDIIPSNQDLYCVNADGSILKLSRSFLTNYVGDLVITDAGEDVAPAKLFIVHWDNATMDFVVRSISFPSTISGHFEHVTFAPINLPPLQ